MGMRVLDALEGCWVGWMDFGCAGGMLGRFKICLMGWTDVGRVGGGLLGCKVGWWDVG